MQFACWDQAFPGLPDSTPGLSPSSHGILPRGNLPRQPLDRPTCPLPFASLRASPPNLSFPACLQFVLRGEGRRFTILSAKLAFRVCSSKYLQEQQPFSLQMGLGNLQATSQNNPRGMDSQSSRSRTGIQSLNAEVDGGYQVCRR